REPRSKARGTTRTPLRAWRANRGVRRAGAGLAGLPPYRSALVRLARTLHPYYLCAQGEHAVRVNRGVISQRERAGRSPPPTARRIPFVPRVKASPTPLCRARTPGRRPFASASGLAEKSRVELRGRRRATEPTPSGLPAATPA